MINFSLQNLTIKYLKALNNQLNLTMSVEIASFSA